VEAIAATPQGKVRGRLSDGVYCIQRYSLRGGALWRATRSGVVENPRSEVQALWDERSLAKFGRSR
jgi:hypothetical protein